MHLRTKYLPDQPHDLIVSVIIGAFRVALGDDPRATYLSILSWWAGHPGVDGRDIYSISENRVSELFELIVYDVMSQRDVLADIPYDPSIRISVVRLSLVDETVTVEIFA